MTNNQTGDKLEEEFIKKFCWNYEMFKDKVSPAEILAFFIEDKIELIKLLSKRLIGNDKKYCDIKIKELQNQKQQLENE